MSLQLDVDAVKNFMSIVDQNGDGFITAKELCNNINNNIYNPLISSMPQLIQQNPENLPLKPENIAIYDLDNNGLFNQQKTTIILEAYLDYLSNQINVPNMNSKKWIENEFKKAFKIFENEQGEEMEVDYGEEFRDVLLEDIPSNNVQVNSNFPDENFEDYLEENDIVLQLRQLENQENPVNISSLNTADYDININNKGIDVIGGDGDIPQTFIYDFLKDNLNNSIIINVLDERDNREKISTIYLYDKDQFINQIKNAIVYPCTNANNVLSSVIKDEPLYNFTKLINRRMNVHQQQLDSILSNQGNIFINLIKLPDTFPAIASYDVVNGLTNNWLSSLHCNAGAEPEQIWNVSIATHNNLEGGKKNKFNIKSTKRIHLRKNKTKNLKIIKNKSKRLLINKKKTMIYKKSYKNRKSSRNRKSNKSRKIIGKRLSKMK